MRMLRKFFQIQKLLDALFDEVWFNFGIPEATQHCELSAD
jgi:hypothetical protein